MLQWNIPIKHHRKRSEREIGFVIRKAEIEAEGNMQPLGYADLLILKLNAYDIVNVYLEIIQTKN